MQDLKLKRDALKKTIDALTHLIAKEINNNQLNNIDELLDQRLDLLVELMALYSSNEDDDEIANYLQLLLQINSELMLSLTHERDGIKNSIINYQKIKRYAPVPDEF